MPETAPAGLRAAISKGWYFGHTRDEATASIERTVMEFFRSLSVEQRMQAMGMERISDETIEDGSIPTDRPLYQETGR